MEGKNAYKPLIDTNIKLKNTKVILLVFVGFLSVFFGGLPSVARAAALFFSPSAGSYNLTKSFSVNVYVSSADQTMNAASGIVSFPADKLQVTSVSKTGSIFNLWVQEPSYSNSAGTVNFEGIVLNPGYTGSQGKILTITFKVKGGGNAPLIISSGSVLANDGQGTNILTSAGRANFTLEIPTTGPTPPESVTPTASAGFPPAPVITSSTHPDPNKWYSKKDARLAWNLPVGATAVRLLLSHIAEGTPIVSYSPPINSIEFIDGKETYNPQPTVLFDTTDALAGIDYYKVKIGEGDFFTLSSDETVKSNPYTLPLQAPGKRTIIVQAVDKAGNITTATDEFIIKAQQPPKFTSYPKRLHTDEFFEAAGQSNPNSKITVWLQRENDQPQSQVTQSDSNGRFAFVAKAKLPEGVWKMWAEETSVNGAKSSPSEKIIFTVSLPWQIRIGQIVIDYISIINTLILIVIGLAVLVFYAWYRIGVWRKKLKKETNEAELKLRKAFSSLANEVKKQIAMFDGQETLNENERTIYEKLKKALDAAEKIIQKEIQDIDKELKKGFFRRLIFWK